MANGNAVLKQTTRWPCPWHPRIRLEAYVSQFVSSRLNLKRLGTITLSAPVVRV